MLIIDKKVIYFIIIAILLWGCSAKVVADPPSVQPTTVDKSNSLFSKEPSDKDRFEEALSYLSNQEKEPNYMEVKARLADLIRLFPKSKWVPGAQAMIICLNRIVILEDALRLEKRQHQDDLGKLAKEMEGLIGNIKQIEDKHSVELVRLQQENEQLRNDISQLKKLEIQLEKRDKMLR